jgi:hypothetical protein
VSVCRVGYWFDPSQPTYVWSEVIMTLESMGIN